MIPLAAIAERYGLKVEVDKDRPARSPYNLATVNLGDGRFLHFIQWDEIFLGVAFHWNCSTRTGKTKLGNDMPLGWSGANRENFDLSEPDSFDRMDEFVRENLAIVSPFRPGLPG